MYEIRQAGAKGLGVFAKSAIPCGTRIFSERPLLFIRADQDAGDVYNSFLLLSSQDRVKVLQLSHTNPSPILRWVQVLWYTIKQLSISPSIGPKAATTLPFPVRSLREHHQILNIFRTDSFALGTSRFHQAIFPNIARINHSCVPNSQGNFHEGLGHFNVHATHDIAAAEELTINYLPEHGAGQEQRQLGLNAYGFTCGCPACDLSTARGRSGEERRLEMQKRLRLFAETGHRGGPEAELKILVKFIWMLKAEGIAGRELSTMYFAAARLNDDAGRLEEALRCAVEGLRIDQDCLGNDHDLHKRNLEVIQALEKRL